MSVAPWDVPTTMDKLTGIVRQTAQNFPWARMVVLPELILSAAAQFVPADSPEPWRKSAESIPGPLTDRLCGLARETGLWLAPGSMYEADGGALYNTAIVISPEGRIAAKYRKMFPWLPYESETTPGDQFCVFDVPDVGRFGLCICYDGWFPEVMRTLAWMGAEVILHPTLTPTSDRHAEVILTQANAIFNQCYVIDVNGLGPWGGGRSLFVDPDGRVLQQAGEHDAVMTETLDLEHVRRTRESGTLGLCQTWKQLRDFRGSFPPYQGSLADGKIYEGLGGIQ